MAEPPKQELEFAREYARVKASQLSPKELQEFFGWTSDKSYYRLIKNCEALGIIKDEPEWTDVRFSDVLSAYYKLFPIRLAQVTDSTTVEEVEDALKETHRLVSALRATEWLSPDERFFYIGQRIISDNGLLRVTFDKSFTTNEKAYFTYMLSNLSKHINGIYDVTALIAEAFYMYSSLFTEMLAILCRNASQSS